MLGDDDDDDVLKQAHDPFSREMYMTCGMQRMLSNMSVLCVVHFPMLVNVPVMTDTLYLPI